MKRSAWVAAVVAGVGFAGWFWNEQRVAHGDDPAPATENGDVDGSGSINITDPIYLLNWLFAGGAPPVPLADSPELLDRISELEGQLAVAESALSRAREDLALCLAGDDAELDVVVLPLLVDTRLGYIAMGPDFDDMPYGGVAEVDLGPPPSLMVDFQEIPEGLYYVEFAGYEDRFAIAGGSSFRTYCYSERGTGVVDVVSGGRNVFFVESSEVVPGCGSASFDRFVLSPNYRPDRLDPYYGSIDGANILRVIVDDADPAAGDSVIVELCDPVDGECPSPFGLFASLPDPSVAPWPRHDDWEDESIGPLDLDENRDLIVYVVVKPGASPATWPIDVQFELAGIERYSVRISNGNAVSVGAE